MGTRERRKSDRAIPQGTSAADSRPAEDRRAVSVWGRRCEGGSGGAFVTRQSAETEEERSAAVQTLTPGQGRARAARARPPGHHQRRRVCDSGTWIVSWKRQKRGCVALHRAGSAQLLQKVCRL
ncbi:hypothetical protein UB44_06605 [Burkholderiaceae bacterium 26]|nr:hypothetical protein UB44_06605 [Burkholderiaceae bacterium 26]